MADLDYLRQPPYSLTAMQVLQHVALVQSTLDDGPQVVITKTSMGHVGSRNPMRVLAAVELDAKGAELAEAGEDPAETLSQRLDRLVRYAKGGRTAAARALRDRLKIHTPPERPPNGNGNPAHD